ncbi:TonB-dependent receptor plug domain-containing protein [Niabella sp. W65]|nr:TonB-dependent receptor plug domain-containing protein [Niabella sp. W65]MCH7364116.1 TonB-dependent receptor plug domain-containing protein [Niabella sp. W65]
MMNTIKSAKVQLIKFMFLLPVVAVLLLSFRKEIKAYHEQVAIEKAHSKQEGAKNGAFATNSQPAVAAVRDTLPSKEPGKATTLKLRNHISLSNPEKKPLIIVDGDRKGQDYDLHAVSPDDIRSIDILKDASAVAQFGEGAENGVIRITTKQADNPAPTLRLRGVDADKAPLYILDGKVLDAKNLSDVNPSDIESVTILKDASTKAIYGSEAANGVVEIKTKSNRASAGDLVFFFLPRATRFICLQKDCMRFQQIK